MVVIALIASAVHGVVAIALAVVVEIQLRFVASNSTNILVHYTILIAHCYRNSNSNL